MTTSNINMNVEPHHDNALHKAAKRKDYKRFTEVIKNNPSLVSDQNSNGDTPLHIAARVGCVKIVKVLTKSHADIEACSDQNDKLLMATNAKNETALHDAAKNGHFDIVKLLMKVEPNLASVENAFGESPLYLAVDRKHLHVATYILRHADPAECSIKGRNGLNVLHAAVIRMQPVHPIGNNRFFLWTLCFYLWVFKGTNIPRYMLEYQRRPATNFIAAVSEKYPWAMTEADKHGWTPLHYAAKLGVYEVVELFVKRDKSVVSVRNNDGMSAIHIAARHGCVRVVEKLGEECENSSKLFDKYHRTPIHYAVEYGNSMVVKKITKIPSFEDLLNEQDIEGNTPLLLASFHGFEEIIKLLVKDKRIDKTAVKNEGLAAIDIIQSHPEVLFPSKVSILKRLKGTSSGLALVNVNNIVVERRKEEAEAKLKELKKQSTVIVLVATLVATVSFSAGFQMPGGYESEGLNKGMANLSHKETFKSFFFFDSLAFLLSTTTILIIWTPDSVHSFAGRVKLADRLTSYFVLAMAAAFIDATSLVLEKCQNLSKVSDIIYYSIYFVMLCLYLKRILYNKLAQISANMLERGF